MTPEVIVLSFSYCLDLKTMHTHGFYAQWFQKPEFCEVSSSYGFALSLSIVACSLLPKIKTTIWLMVTALRVTKEHGGTTHVTKPTLTGCIWADHMLRLLTASTGTPGEDIIIP